MKKRERAENQELNPSNSEHFLVNMKRESLLILRSRRRRRVLKISSVRNFNVYRNNIAIIWRNATKMPV